MGPDGEPAAHVHACNKNKSVLHNHVRDVLADIGNSVAKDCVLTERGIDPTGQPCVVDRRQGHAVPGDVVCPNGRAGAWIFADTTVVLNKQGMCDETATVRAGRHSIWC